MPTKISYSGKRLIPAPQLSIAKSYQTTGDGTKIGSVFTINVTGKFVTHKGSPNASGEFYTGATYPSDDTVASTEKLASTLRKQEAMRTLFADEGLSFEVQSADGSPPVKFNPRNIQVDFPQGQWYTVGDYNISMEADVVYINGTAVGEDDFSQRISSASESWDLQYSDQAESVETPYSYTLTHSVNAVGKKRFDANGNLLRPAWQEAREWVVDRLGFDSTIVSSSGVNNLPSYFQGYNHSRSEQIGEMDGSYSVSENWIVASGTSLETFDVSTNISQEETRVSINGQITGLEERNANMDITTSKYTNAQTKFNQIKSLVYDRAKDYSGMNLNTRVLASTVGRNPTQGTISYSYEYNNAPPNAITASKNEILSINKNFDVDLFALVPVLGRARGPVRQDLGTKQECKKSVSFEVLFDESVYASGSTLLQLATTKHPLILEPQKSEIEDLIDALSPVSAGDLNNVGVAASTQHVSNKSANWNPVQRRYNFEIEWTYE